MDLRKTQPSSTQKKLINNPLDFFKERGGEVFENEFGWANYYLFDKGCYLENFYIYPEFRKSQKGTSLLSQLELKIKEFHGCETLTTTISRSLGNTDRTLQICLKRGFSFHSSNNDAIILKKEL